MYWQCQSIIPCWPLYRCMLIEWCSIMWCLLSFIKSQYPILMFISSYFFFVFKLMSLFVKLVFIYLLILFCIKVGKEIKSAFRHFSYLITECQCLFSDVICFLFYIYNLCIYLYIKKIIHVQNDTKNNIYLWFHCSSRGNYHLYLSLFLSIAG